MQTKINVLFFSRGRGRGHAIPDVEIATALARLAPDVSLQFASYATGRDVIAATGFSVTDMALPEVPGFVPSLLRAVELICKVKPDIVVSHEEFSALVAAKSAGIPSIFICDWFPRSENVLMEALRCADSMLFIDTPGVFPVPPGITEHLHFVGPLIRTMKYSLSDRDLVRTGLGIPQEATVVSIMPGAWATEERAPIADLVCAALSQFGLDDDRFYWLTKRDFHKVTEKARCDGRIKVIQESDCPERFIVASNAVITKGNRGTIMEAAWLGIPTLSLSHGFNRVDEVLVARIKSNVSVNATDATPLAVRNHLRRITELPSETYAKQHQAREHGGIAAAQKLITEIVRLSGTTVASAGKPLNRAGGNTVSL